MPTTTKSFAAPGPGTWELETAHFPRPASRLVQHATLAGFAAGFAESTARFGVMLSHLQPAYVNDFAYMQAVPFGAPPGAKGPPPRAVFWLLTRAVPKLRARVAASHDAFERKLWREDLNEWDARVKPAADARHRQMQALSVEKLDARELAAHLAECVANNAAMVRQHHRFTITCTLPIGDFLAQVGAWTGRPTGEILAAVRGASAISLGAARAELQALAEAVARDPAARATLDGDGPAADTLARLCDAGGDVGSAARAYLDVVRHRAVGYDVCAPSAGELPDTLLGAVRAATRGAGSRGDTDGARAISSLRERVPVEHRARFDELLAEARHIARLRDERGHHSEGWAIGITRRAVLEAGRRLAADGQLRDAALLLDATPEELDRFVTAGRVSEAERAELEARRAWRTTKSVSDADVPKFLGGEPGAPPPVDWLPERGRRAGRAVEAVMTGIFQEPAPAGAEAIKGLAVSPGVYEGTARLVDREEEFGRIAQGDVLVTRATAPYFNVVLPLLGAIVTDRGGQLCHAAIVAREYGIPGVVGTIRATAKIRDGQRVRVDGDTGEVTLLG